MKRSMRALVGGSLVAFAVGVSAQTPAEPTAPATLVTAATNTVYPIDLPTALRLAGAQNLDVQIAREKLRAAEGDYEQARLKYFPWITPGIGYRRHDGNIQDVGGKIFEASKQSYNLSLGLEAQIELGDAIYDSLAKRKLAEAGIHGAEASRQDTVLRAALAYLELARAQASIGVAEESLRISTEYAAQVGRAVEAGIAFKGDAIRADVQRRHNAMQVARLEEERAVAAAYLVTTLRLAPGTQLVAKDIELSPTTLVESSRGLDSLLAQAVNSRPELRELALLFESAQADRKNATTGPLIPTIGGFATLGGLGGGQNDGWGDFGAYGDYGIGLSWKLGRGGLFDRGRTRSADARARVVELEQMKRGDEILREVIVARNRADSLTTRIRLAQEAVAASDELLKLTQSRREFGVGVVFEAVQAEEDLTAARLELLRHVAEFNRVQWELQHAIGGSAPQPSAP